MRIAFDIGGVISKYPDEFRRLMGHGGELRDTCNLQPANAASAIGDATRSAFMALRPRRFVACQHW